MALTVTPLGRPAHDHRQLRTLVPQRTAAAAQSASNQSGGTQTSASSGPASFAAVFQAASATSSQAASSQTAATSVSSAIGAGSTGASEATGPAGPLFGANPWVGDPTGQGPGGVTHYNPEYFATGQTAEIVAQMVGGQVVQGNSLTNAPGSPFTLNQPELMVQLPNGGEINPGLIASLFTHNWPQSFINQQIANEVAGAAQAGINT